MTGKPSALITGVTGQDGSYLAELLLEKGYDVHGMVRRASTEKFDRIEHIRDRITLHQGDLLDQRSLVDTLRAARPGEIYNLAAMSFVAVSWIQPTLTAEFTGVGRDADAGGDARSLPAGALLPGLLQRDVRQGARGAPDRDDPLLSALALRRGEGVRALHHRQLPRVLRPARDLGDPVQPRVRRGEHTPDREERAISSIKTPADLVPLRRKGQSTQSFTPDNVVEVWDGEDWTYARAITATRRRRTDPDSRTAEHSSLVAGWSM